MTSEADTETAAALKSLKYLEAPDKSENDKKNYKCLILPNGLKVLLVADNKTGNSTVSADKNVPEEEKLSAVAVLVDVGSFSQPREYQGLAHFLEHMIFMGSKKYPIENSFDKQISKFGGSNNACTDEEETVYYFEIPEKHLDSSMDCFAAQMKEPLLLEDSMTREREAVESEFQRVLNNDEVRLIHVLKSLSNENFPYDCFTWGNFKSLKETIKNEQELHKALIDFYNRHYSAHRTILCIQSCLTLEELEHLAIKHFGDMRNNNLTGLDFSKFNYQQAFRKDFYEEVFFIKPIENVIKLDLTWVFPSTEKLYKCKPAEFLSHLLGYEGEGSLCAYLRKRLWALEVMTDPSTNPMFTLFNICITLSESGLKNLDEVLTATFAYIKLFSKASQLKELYDELSYIKASDFRYTSESSAVDNVQYFVRCSKYYPSKDIITGSQLYYEFIEEQVQNLLDHLNEFHFNITLTSQTQNEDVLYDKKEKWFGTEYCSKKMPENWLKLWENCPQFKELSLPRANPFIARDFQILYSVENGRNLPVPEIPEKLMQTETYELWFRQDDKFNLPHGYMNFYLLSPLIRDSARNIILCSLYLDLVKYHLIEELYPASMAGINYNVYCAEKGIVITVDGYNEKLHLVVELVMKALISTKENFNKNQLEMFKKQQQKNYFNALIKPEVLNMDLHGYVLKEKQILLSEKFKYVKDVNVEDIKEFAIKFSEELYVQSLIQGNFEKQTAIKTMNSVMEYLKCTNLKDKSIMEDRGTEIPLGCHKLLCQNLNPKDSNTIVANFYQIGPRSLRNECILQLFIMILEAPVYDVLRTKEQLGYCVSCYQQVYFGIMGYSIYINSQETKHTSMHVEERIETFRQGIHELLEKLSLEDFTNFKNSIIKLKEIKDLTLGEEVDRNWGEITSGDYCFQRKQKEIEILRQLEKQDILEFWQTNETKNLRKLSIQVMGVKDTEASEEFTENTMDNKLILKFLDIDKNGTNILDVEKFKEKLHVYPVIKIDV